MHMDWHYAVDIDYEVDTDCDALCDSYCRCSQIVNARVKSVDIDYCIDKIIENIFANVSGSNKLVHKRALERATELKNDESTRYVIDRVLRHYKIYDPKI